VQEVLAKIGKILTAYQGSPITAVEKKLHVHPIKERRKCRILLKTKLATKDSVRETATDPDFRLLILGKKHW